MTTVLQKRRQARDRCRGELFDGGNYMFRGKCPRPNVATSETYWLWVVFFRLFIVRTSWSLSAPLVHFVSTHACIQLRPWRIQQSPVLQNKTRAFLKKIQLWLAVLYCVVEFNNMYIMYIITCRNFWDLKQISQRNVNTVMYDQHSCEHHANILLKRFIYKCRSSLQDRHILRYTGYAYATTCLGYVRPTSKMAFRSPRGAIPSFATYWLRPWQVAA